ncbi:putative membrane protein [Filimonas lacunae]|uniref:Putative membrane protein n=2 Tax=Filimonas lacunae TaxID=477680 RepID=A0A1N7P263_9BACT|nr:putative membrane protein [Filimonas lacunae]
MLFVWKGSVLPQLLPRLLLLLVFSVAVVYVRGTFGAYKIPLNPAPFTLFGLALALFLGFRNSASYDRFWEGRKLWGALLNDTRSLARQATTLCRYETGAKQQALFIRYLVAFTYALKHQLRHTDARADLERLLPADTARRMMAAQYKPIMLLKEMGLWIDQAKAERRTDSILQSAMETNLNKLSDIVGGCERLANTLIPYTYKVLLHRTVYVYCFLLPFAFVDSLGWMTPIVVVFIAYTFTAWEAIADEIEEPFGTEPNDLALDGMCKMIENTLLELNGEPLANKLSQEYIQL